ncbi:MAG: DUF3887 domain-containing protein [Bacteroidales bacterium]
MYHQSDKHFIIKKVYVIFFLVLFFSGSLTGQTRNIALLEKKAKEILILLDSGKYTEITRMFDERLNKGLPPQKLEKSWKDLIYQVGPFQGLEQIRSEPYVGSTIVICTGKFGDLLVDLKLQFNGAGQVSALYFLPHDYVPPSPAEDTIRGE